MKEQLIIILSVILFFLRGFASDFYVSPMASGSGDGSIDNPWQISYAIKIIPMVSDSLANE